MEQKNNFGLLLGLSIAELICCCQPAGIAGIILSILANVAYRNGNYEGYASKAKIAKIILIIGAAVGVIINVLYVIAIMGQAGSY